MKDLEFKCASITGTKKGDSMVVKKNHVRNNILFKSIEKHKFKISKNNICLSPKDSLKLATTIINEFCDTKKLSKRVLKSRIACQKVLILELRQEINELKQKNLESTKSYDDIKDLNL